MSKKVHKRVPQKSTPKIVHKKVQKIVQKKVRILLKVPKIVPKIVLFLKKVPKIALLRALFVVQTLYALIMIFRAVRRLAVETLAMCFAFWVKTRLKTKLSRW